MLGLFLWFITHFKRRGRRLVVLGRRARPRPVHPTKTALVLIVAVTLAIVILTLMSTFGSH